MYVIEDKGKINFYEGARELSTKDGFARLQRLYQYEPTETKHVIEKLQRKYQRQLKETK